jgi:hypothetical protein
MDSEGKNWFLEAGTLDLVGPFTSWADAYEHKEEFGPWEALILDVEPDDEDFQAIPDDEEDEEVLNESVLIMTPEQHKVFVQNRPLSKVT